MGQERHLQPARPRRKGCFRWGEGYIDDHCESCGVTFVSADDPYRQPDAIRDGYATVSRGEFPNNYHRICATCYSDFKDVFDREVVG